MLRRTPPSRSRPRSLRRRPCPSPCDTQARRRERPWRRARARSAAPRRSARSADLPATSATVLGSLRTRTVPFSQHTSVKAGRSNPAAASSGPALRTAAARSTSLRTEAAAGEEAVAKRRQDDLAGRRADLAGDLWRERVVARERFKDGPRRQSPHVGGRLGCGGRELEHRRARCWGPGWPEPLQTAERQVGSCRPGGREQEAEGRLLRDLRAEGLTDTLLGARDLGGIDRRLEHSRPLAPRAYDGGHARHPRDHRTSARPVQRKERVRSLTVRPAAEASPFDGHYGLEIEEASHELVRGRVLVRDHHKQPTGVVHGGVYASIAEALASLRDDARRPRRRQRRARHVEPLLVPAADRAAARSTRRRARATAAARRGSGTSTSATTRAGSARSAA